MNLHLNRLLLGLALLLPALGLPAVVAAAPAPPSIHDFSGPDGHDPAGDLIQGRDGNFYGTTNQGGTDNLGTVFQLTPTGTLTILVSFPSVNNAALGSYPQGALLQAADGSFYGTTTEGGMNGYGTVFKLTPSGSASTLATLVDFTGTTGAALGSFPVAGLVQDASGNLYGTTRNGGVNQNGTVFQLTPTGTFTTLVDFTGTTGAALGFQPDAALTPEKDAGGRLTGSFYGTTAFGGNGKVNNTEGNGTVFKLTPSGSAFTLTTVISFTYTSAYGFSGYQPLAALIQGKATDGSFTNSFYGTTGGGGANGGGTVFQLTPGAGNAPATLTTLVDFSNNIGTGPFGGLVQAADGSFYGTTKSGGTGDAGANEYGTVFQVTPGAGTNPATLTTLVNFSGANGAAPYTGLAQAADGALYGTTAFGGVYGDGTIFRLQVSGPVASLTFTTQPQAALVGEALNGTAGIVVQARDAAGLLVSGVAVTLRDSKAKDTLDGLTTVTTDGSGNATFTGLTLDRPGRYHLTATAGTLTRGVESSAFDIQPNKGHR